MKKVLFISSRPIYPVIGGDQIRTSQQLEYLVQRYIVDVIYLSEHVLEDQTKKYLPSVRNAQNIIKYIDFVDAISMNYDKAKQLSHGLKRLIYMIDSKRCLEYEQLIIETFDSCAIISDIDKKYIIKCQQKFM